MNNDPSEWMFQPLPKSTFLQEALPSSPGKGPARALLPTARAACPVSVQRLSRPRPASGLPPEAHGAQAQKCENG